ncbi:hypothetical protein C2G38_8224 [Gigaspora rosea]|uniref:Ion transport domain-containing protein n=1 Tax=Gigaspora rosea TaxID=44941 RepID=A0A397W1B1_9GLOM|nr:hypothetical protein C2G38_8224 [Gigaspora rosea]
MNIYKINFFLILYGEKLIKDLIDEDQDTLLRKLCNRCIKIIFESDQVLSPNIQLFRIISHSISEIFKVNPTFFADFVIQISFLCIFDQRYLKRFLKNKIPPKHLNHYGYYSSLSKLTHLDSLIEFYFNNSFLNSILKYTKEIISWIKRYKYRMRVGYYYEKQLEKHPRLLLMFPLQHFVTYPKEYNFWKELFKPKPSRFIELSEIYFYKTWNDAFYKTWNGEALINYKWNTFGRKYYLAIWAIYTVFLCSFIIVATLSDHMSWDCQKIFLHATIILGSWHLFFELRQFIYSPKVYFSSIWNYLDLVTIISTMTTSINWLKFGYASTWAITFSTLLLELKFIIFFRYIEFFGIYLAMIMNTVDKVVSFLIIFGLVIFAFAHSLHLLLRSVSETFQDSNKNMFTQFGTAIIASYYIMITGNFSPISSFVTNENIIIMLLMMLFSFFTIIYLMNVFIGIYSNLVGNADNHVVCLALKRDIIVEIELFYLLPFQRRKYDWFPETL